MIAGRLSSNVPLAPLTTFGIGGPARLYLAAASESDVAEAEREAADRRIDLLVLGGGSNLLVADRGFDGMVVHVGIRGLVESEGPDGRVLVTAGAGEDWDGFVGRMVAEDLAGLECLSGIPGRVGATPIQNVGAYGQEVSQTIVSVRAWDRRERRFVELGPGDCRFAYRTSVFKAVEPGRWIVVAVTFGLQRGAAASVRYAELARVLATVARPGLEDVRRAVLELRRAKSMVIDATDVESTSAGSFFLNPLLPVEQADEVLGPAGGPRFETRDGRVKVPAAWLIEQAGFRKGESLGRAGISKNHALALVNRGGATAAEILELARTIRERVKGRFGVELVMEPVLVGFEERVF